VVVFYRHRSGADDCEVLGPALSGIAWTDLRSAATALLQARGFQRAADLLGQIPFRLSDGTNVFSDEFAVLDAVVSIDDYVKFSSLERDTGAKAAFAEMADVLSETPDGHMLLDLGKFHDVEPTARTPDFPYPS